MSDNLECILCNKKFRLLRHHLVTTHKNNFKNKYEIELFYLTNYYKISKEQIEDICKEYTNGYSFLDLKEKYGIDAHNLIVLSGIKLRTNSESKKTKTYIEKYKSTNIERYGTDNVSKLNEIKEKKEKTFLEHFGYKNNFSNKSIQEKGKKSLSERTIEQKEKQQEKYIKTCLEKYGVDNVIKFIETRNKSSKSTKERFSKMTIEDRKLFMKIPREALMKSCSACRSNIEIRVENIIKKDNIQYKTGGIIQYRSFDFVFEEQKIAIEIQGDYFHANPLRYKPDDYFKQCKLTAKQKWKSDFQKKLIAERNGYKVYYIWENYIHKSSDENILNVMKIILEKNNT